MNGTNKINVNINEREMSINKNKYFVYLKRLL